MAVVMVLRASVARSANSVRKLCTGRPSSVRPVVCLLTAAGDRCHAATEPGEARDDVTSDIEPNDQEGARQAQRRDGEKDVSPEGLHARRFGVGAVDLVL